MEAEKKIGSPMHVEPILAVHDVLETVGYWHDVLGFPDKWTWGEPPEHGGVSWHGTFIQFSHNPGLASVSKGNAIFIRVRELEALYDFHQNRKAVIVEPLENKPWGMAGYTVQDINGYNIIFAGGPISDKVTSSKEILSTVKIIARQPTVKEYQYLTTSVGWSMYSNDDVVKRLLIAPVFAVIAEDETTNKIIGCALLLGDHASFYYIKDVVVHPDYQSKHVGTAMMKELIAWLEKYGARNALVALISGENLAPFYQQFDFAPSFSMVKYLQQKEISK